MHKRVDIFCIYVMGFVGYLEKKTERRCIEAAPSLLQRSQSCLVFLLKVFLSLLNSSFEKKGKENTIKNSVCLPSDLIYLVWNLISIRWMVFWFPLFIFLFLFILNETSKT
jgi:hypothetical protein